MKALLLLLASGMLFRELILPDASLDGSCMLALQEGFLKGTDFGAYLINTYGLLSFLISSLFHPRTYYLSLAFQVATTLIALWPAVYLRWGARFVFVLLLCLLCNHVAYLTDPFVFAALLSTFTLAVLDRRVPSLIGAAVIGVLALAKWSVPFIALPLFALADVRTAIRKRSWPLQSLTFLAVIVLAFVISGQRLASLPRYIRNGYEISASFALAVTSLRGLLPLEGQLAFIACSAALAAILFGHARAAHKTADSPNPDASEQLLLLGLGWLWIFFAVYHASYVRPDGGHFYIGWNTLLLTLPVTLFVAQSLRSGAPGLRYRDITLIVSACALFVFAAEYPPLWRTPRPPELSSRLSTIVAGKVRTVRALLAWADRDKVRLYKKARVRALQAIALRDMPVGRETVDAYPFDLAPVIAAGLSYQPRPTMQAQVAYSPYLQRLDLDHWRGPKAPDHLLFQLGDIDGRLPTLALGPSVVELLSRYDPVGRVGGVLHLRRRGSFRPVTRRVLTKTTLTVGGGPVRVPHVEGSLTLARIHLPQTLAGHLLNLLKPPFLMIDVRLATGVVGRYRFVPSMAELGFAISPELESLLGSFYQPAREETDLIDGLKRSTPAEEFRIREVGFLGQYAFGQAEVEFSLVQFQRNDGQAADRADPPSGQPPPAKANTRMP